MKAIDALNEVEPIPYFIDLIDFNTINNSKLQKHILEEGKLIVEKTGTAKTLRRRSER